MVEITIRRHTGFAMRAASSRCLISDTTVWKMGFSFVGVVGSSIMVRYKSNNRPVTGHGYGSDVR